MNANRPAARNPAYRVGLLVALLGLGCNTDPCACSPPVSALVFFGRVLTVGGQPIEAAAVTVTLTTPLCDFTLTGPPSPTTTTGADGRFAVTVALGSSEANACARITAHRASGQFIASNEGILVRFPTAPIGVDSLEVVLREQQ